MKYKYSDITPTKLVALEEIITSFKSSSQRPNGITKTTVEINLSFILALPQAIRSFYYCYRKFEPIYFSF